MPMTGLPLILADLLVAYMIFIQPIAGYRSFRKFTQQIERNKKARSQFYLRGIALKWLLVFIIGVILATASLAIQVIGLQAPSDIASIVLWLLYLGFLLLISTLIYRRIARRPGGKALLQKLFLAPIQLLPVTKGERLLWIVASLTAGICEEILYRGFMLFYLIAVFPRLDVLNAIILSSIFFGIAHMYQGWKGILATGFVGLLLAWFYYMTGSLLLPIIIHALIDLRAMFLFPQEKAST